MSGNPIAYAEETLGVHKVYIEAESLLAQYKTMSDTLKGVSADIRAHRAHEAELERAITASVDPSGATSKTALKELIKFAIENDPKIIEIREKIQEFEQARFVLETDMHFAEVHLRTLQSRMTELGGLLQFYAATKLVAHKSN